MLGAPVLLGAFIALWYPPDATVGSTTNLIYLAVVLGAVWWGFTLVVAISFVIVNLLVDLLYTYLDPRVRVS